MCRAPGKVSISAGFPNTIKAGNERVDRHADSSRPRSKSSRRMTMSVRRDFKFARSANAFRRRFFSPAAASAVVMATTSAICTSRSASTVCANVFKVPFLNSYWNIHANASAIINRGVCTCGYNLLSSQMRPRNRFAQNGGELKHAGVIDWHSLQRAVISAS